MNHNRGGGKSSGAGDAPTCHETAARLADYSGAQYIFIPGKSSGVQASSGLELGESEGACSRAADIGLYNFSDLSTRQQEPGSSGQAMLRDSKTEQNSKVGRCILMQPVFIIMTVAGQEM